MTASTFEGALERMMATGTPAAVARSVSTETWMLVSPFRSVKSKTTYPLPTNGIAGDSYIVPSGGDATQIALLGGDGVWHYSSPSPGDFAYVQDEAFYYSFIGGVWIVNTYVPSPVSGSGAKIVDYTAIATDNGKIIRFDTTTAGAELNLIVSHALGSLAAIWECDVERFLSDMTGNFINVYQDAILAANFVGQITSPNNGRTVSRITVRSDGTNVYCLGQP